MQQLALRVSVAAGGLASALRASAPRDKRLDTGALADVARAVRQVKPLACWLDRWPAAGEPLAQRRAALLALALEAATSAQRDRFAEQPARAVAACARAAADAADYIVREVADPLILQPAALDAVTLRQAGKPLGFAVVPSFCGHHRLAHIRFGSPAHASGAVHEGDEIVQVGARCVIGWSGAAVERACAAAARGGELPLRLRRRAPPLPAPRPLLRARAPAAPPAPAADSSDSSEALSPPASPAAPHARLFPAKPRPPHARRHSVSGGSPRARRAPHGIEQVSVAVRLMFRAFPRETSGDPLTSPLSCPQFWRELKEQRWERGGGSAGGSPAPQDRALYRRDKVNCPTPRLREYLCVANMNVSAEK